MPVSPAARSITLATSASGMAGPEVDVVDTTRNERSGGHSFSVSTNSTTDSPRGRPSAEYDPSVMRPYTGGMAGPPAYPPYPLYGYAPPGRPGPGGMMPGGLNAADEGAPLRRYDFTLQFAWKPVVPAEPKPAADEAGAPAGN